MTEQKSNQSSSINDEELDAIINSLEEDNVVSSSGEDLDLIQEETDLSVGSSVSTRKKKKYVKKPAPRQEVAESNNEELLDRDENGLPIYQGTAKMPEMNSQQKKAMQQLLFRGTQDITTEDPETRQQARVLPDTEVKTDHLFIKDMKLSKDFKSGSWVISEVNTNQGIFELGPNQNERINQDMIRNLALYLRELFEEDLKTFINEE